MKATHLIIGIYSLIAVSCSHNEATIPPEETNGDKNDRDGTMYQRQTGDTIPTDE